MNKLLQREIRQYLPALQALPRGADHYLDPPYWGNEGDYGKALFQRSDFERLAAVLRAIKGRFIMSLNDRPEIRDLFASFDQEPIETTYHVAGGKAAKRAGELIISGGGGT